MTDAELMGLLAGPIGLMGLSRMPATPGDPRGGFLEGQPDQLQKLPGRAQGHGGEFVVNAAATARFRPLLEAINRAVPPPAGVRPERPGQGRAYFGGGESGVGVGEGGDDSGVGGVGAVGSESGVGVGDPGAEGMTPGMSLSDAHAATVSDALSGALSGVVGSVTGGMMGTSPDATATALGVALGLAGLGPVGAPAAAAAVGAANAQTAAMSGLTGLTAGEISNAMAAENTAAADAAAGTGLGPGGQGGADEPGEARDPRGTPPASLSLRDYLAWLRSATTIPTSFSSRRHSSRRCSAAWGRPGWESGSAPW